MTRGTGDSEDGFVRLDDGGEIAYQIRGRHQGGTPVLLVRPLGGSMSLWGGFRAALSEKHRVIAYDLRGSGHSSADPGFATTRTIARDALRVLDHLDVPRANVFGISLGGMAATWLAIDAADRVERLCIASAPPRGLEISRHGLGRELEMALCLLRKRSEAEPSLVHRVLSERFRAEHPDRVAHIEALIRAEPSTRMSLVRHAMAALFHDALGSLPAVKAETLVLAGSEDQLLGTDAPKHLATCIRGSSFEIIDRAGHDLTLERPIETAERVHRFFDSTSRTASLGNREAGS